MCNQIQLSTFAISLFISSAVLAAPSKKPNVLFIMADDLGWTDLGVMGSDYYETPHMDKLASQGMLFRQAYAAAANSAPSRACFMTGMYTPRHGVFTVNPPDRGDKRKRKLIAMPNQEDLDARFITLAEALKEEGYCCGHVGKWHLGADAEGTGPLSQGFSSNIAGERAGTPYSYFYPYIQAHTGKVHIGLETGSEGEYLTDRLTSEAIRFMSEERDEPFFLYLSHHAVHTPLKAPEELIAKYQAKTKGENHKNAVYAAMVESLDESVGRLLKAVDSLGIANETVVILYSDNGGSKPITQNRPLREGKGSPYEGGTRVPLIIRWPGKLASNSSSDLPVIGVDFYPTLVGLAGGHPAMELDGKNIFELLEEPTRERALFWHFPAYLESYEEGGNPFRATPYSTILSGGWKLIYFYERGEAELYNLNEDLSEKNNLALVEPGKREELYAQLREWLTQTQAPIPIQLNPFYQELE
ncbi:MAG: sulfatase [Phocaeicola sp.]